MLLKIGPRATLLSEENPPIEKIFIIKNKIEELIENRQNNNKITYKARLNYVSAIK